MTYSVSRIERALSCMTSFFYTYVCGGTGLESVTTGYAMSQGRCVGELLDAFIKGTTFDVDDFINNTDIRYGKTQKPELLKASIFRCFETIKSEFGFDQYKDIKTEVPVNGTLFGYQFTGYIDFLGITHQDQIKVTDWKVSTKPITIYDVMKNFQLAVYVNLLGIDESLISLGHCKPNKTPVFNEVETVYNHDLALEHLGKQIGGTIPRIKDCEMSGIYPENRWGCDLCDFKPLCQGHSDTINKFRPRKNRRVDSISTPVKKEIAA